MLLGLVLVLSLFLFFPSPLFYTLSLISLVSLCFFWLTYYSLFPVLLSLLILILYIGAMMVIISYVSATVPNFLPTFSLSGGLMVGLLGIMLLLSLMLVSDPIYSSFGYHSGGDYLFLVSGGWVFVTLALFLFVMLLICSLLVVQKGTFRSF